MSERNSVLENKCGLCGSFAAGMNTSQWEDGPFSIVQLRLPILLDLIAVEACRVLYKARIRLEWGKNQLSVCLV